jgi:hypothetical protein
MLTGKRRAMSQTFRICRPVDHCAASCCTPLRFQYFRECGYAADNRLGKPAGQDCHRTAAFRRGCPRHGADFTVVDFSDRLARGRLGGDMANKSQFSIVTYERLPGHWRAAITPFAQSGSFIRGKTTFGIVTGDDSASEPDAMHAAEQLIKSL